MCSSRFDKVNSFLEIVVVSFMCCLPCSCGGSPRPDHEMVISAWVVYWDAAKGAESIESNVAALDEINPFYYAFDDKGNIIENSPGIETAHPLPSVIRSGRLRVVPTIVNDTIYPDKASKLKDTDVIRFLLEDPKRMERHVDSICQLVETQNYDGIDIDYEKLLPSDRDLFTRFVEILAGRLHAEDKLLTVTVQPMTSEAHERKPGGLDWSAIGAAADRVRIMCYNYSYPGSAPGPVAPPEWIAQIIDYAHKKVPVEKISLALKLQGFDWSELEARSVTFERATAIAKEYDADVRWDAESSTPYFTYHHDGLKHEVWFENARSLEAKFQVIARNSIGGISLWRLGGEDPDIFGAITRYKKKHSE
jgi:spore germination protein